MPNCTDGSKDRRARAPAVSRTRENTVLQAPAPLPAHCAAGSCLSPAPHPRVDAAPAAPAPGLPVVKHSGHTGVSASELLTQTLRLQRHLPRFQPILPPRSPAVEERGTRSNPLLSKEHSSRDSDSAGLTRLTPASCSVSSDCCA